MIITPNLTPKNTLATASKERERIAPTTKSNDAVT
jgi:hypothetical protein